MNKAIKELNELVERAKSSIKKYENNTNEDTSVYII